MREENTDIRIFMRRTGVRQRDVAKVMSISQSTVSNELSEPLSEDRRKKYAEAIRAAARTLYGTDEGFML